MKCPKCGATIKYLQAYSIEENRQTVELDENGELDWSASEPVESSSLGIDFECPECFETIYSNDGSSTDPQIKALLMEESKV